MRQHHKGAAGTQCAQRCPETTHDPGTELEGMGMGAQSFGMVPKRRQTDGVKGIRRFICALLRLGKGGGGAL